MKKISLGDSFESSSEFYDSYIDEKVGVINLKGDIFELATDLPLKEAIYGKVRLSYRLPEIKVLLILSGESALGEDKLAQFEKSIKGSADGEIKLVREENALSQFIRLMCGSSKIVISGVRGSVVGPFLGAILSADQRVASENTVFSFPYVNLELSPQGALAFFLRQYLGTVRAKKILLSCEPLSAVRALELGLVDDVVAENIFEEKCVEIAKKLSAIPAGVVDMTKRLTKCDLKDLDAYLKMETEMGK
jgi:enoyl-CoA hydratase/carnithine racemase